MKSRQQDDVFAQILCKFIVNLPRNQRTPTRLWYHYEKAYFYYIDHEKHRHNRSKKPPTENERQQKLDFLMSMNKMAPIGFQINAEKIYQDIAYAYDNIPVYGVILLNEKQTKIVCVSAKGKLGLPKGKVDEGETPTICATRECWEEIGYDVSTKINFYDKIEVEGDVKKTVFFIVSNVKEESVKFNPQSVTEVDAVVWVAIEEANQQRLTKVTRKALQKLELHLLAKRKDQSKYEVFLQSFKFELENNTSRIPKEDPFKMFKLDRQKLISILQ